LADETPFHYAAQICKLAQDFSSIGLDPQLKKQHTLDMVAFLLEK
jgi:hypothetical protein